MATESQEMMPEFSFFVNFQFRNFTTSQHLNEMIYTLRIMLTVLLVEVSAYRRLKRQCLCVAGTTKGRPISTYLFNKVLLLIKNANCLLSLSHSFVMMTTSPRQTTSIIMNTRCWQLSSTLSTLLAPRGSSELVLLGTVQKKAFQSTVVW